MLSLFLFFGGVATERCQPLGRVLGKAFVVIDAGATLAKQAQAGDGRRSRKGRLEHLVLGGTGAGSVTIDGYDVRNVKLTSIRSQIGVVLQDSFLFSDTVMSNIRFGRPAATDDEVFSPPHAAGEFLRFR